MATDKIKFVGGQILFNGSSIVFNSDCCCDNVTGCCDTSIPSTIYASGVGNWTDNVCPNCDQISAGDPYGLTWRCDCTWGYLAQNFCTNLDFYITASIVDGVWTVNITITTHTDPFGWCPTSVDAFKHSTATYVGDDAGDCLVTDITLTKTTENHVGFPGAPCSGTMPDSITLGR